MSASLSLSPQALSDESFKSGLFRCEVKRKGDSASLHLFGELDLAARDELLSALAAAAESPAGLSVDLTDLQFIDCAGLAVLHQAAARAKGRGGKVVLLGGSGQVQRMLELTGCPAGAERRRRAPDLKLVAPIAGGQGEAVPGAPPHAV